MRRISRRGLIAILSAAVTRRPAAMANLPAPSLKAAEIEEMAEEWGRLFRVPLHMVTDIESGPRP